MKYFVYNKNSGEILRSGVCTPADLNLQAGENEIAVVGVAETDGSKKVDVSKQNLVVIDLGKPIKQPLDDTPLSLTEVIVKRIEDIEKEIVMLKEQKNK